MRRIPQVTGQTVLVAIVGLGMAAGPVLKAATGATGSFTNPPAATTAPSSPDATTSRGPSARQGSAASLTSPTATAASPAAPEPPRPAAPGSLEYRAAQAMASGDFAAALPLLRRLAEVHKDDPRRLRAIEEQIRVAERALNTGDIPGITPSDQRRPLPPPQAGQITEFQSIHELGNFEYDPEKGGNIPPDVLAYSDTRIRVRGYMIPMDQAANITTFALVPSLFACCFGTPPQIQHTIVVRTPRGKAVSYFPDEIVVEGELKVVERKEDGFIISVFEMTASSVRPLPPAP